MEINLQTLMVYFQVWKCSLLCGAEIAPADPDDVLPRAKCEDALRAVRHARWFEVINVLVHFGNDSASCIVTP